MGGLLSRPGLAQAAHQLAEVVAVCGLEEVEVRAELEAREQGGERLEAVGRLDLLGVRVRVRVRGQGSRDRVYLGLSEHGRDHGSGVRGREG